MDPKEFSKEFESITTETDYSQDLGEWSRTLKQEVAMIGALMRIADALQKLVEAITEKNPALGDRLSLLQKKGEEKDWGKISRIPIEILKLSGRTESRIKQLGFHTIGDLITATESQLLKQKSVGRKTVLEVKLALSEYGLGFNMRFDL